MITRMLFLLGYDLGSRAAVSLACYPVLETLRSTGVLNRELSGSLNQQNNDLYHQVISIMQYGADCRKNPLNVIPLEEATLPKGAPRVPVPDVFQQAGLKLDL